MHAPEMAHSTRAWRDRLAGRVAFNQSAAETAVRRAYRASDLPEPRQIVWVSGPSEAAQAIAFLERPPHKLRYIVLSVLVLGLAVWVGLALAIDSNALAARPWSESVIWSVVLAALGLTLGIWPRLRAWPGLPTSRRSGVLNLLGAMVFLVLAGCSFALLHLGGVSADSLGRGAALALAAAAGTMPGVFAYVRLRRACAHLPRFLLEVRAPASVGYQLEQAQQEAWAPFRRSATGAQPNEALVQAYRHVHWQAFARRQGRLPAAGWDGSGWITGGVFADPHSGIFVRIPPHLDGIAAAPRAAAVGGAAPTDPAAAFAELAFHVDRLYPFAAIAVAVRPATTVALDAEGRPHSEDGPALAWEDGTSLYAWHGRMVPYDVIDPNRPVTRSRIDHETDPDRRWVLIQRYGLGRYMLEAGAAEIGRDAACGRLYRLPQRLSEPIVAVRVMNHTPDADGSFREFWLRVPPTVMTPRQAVAWTFDLPPQAYDPVAQS